MRVRVATGVAIFGKPQMQLSELCWEEGDICCLFSFCWNQTGRALIIAKQTFIKISKFTIKCQCIPVHKALVGHPKWREFHSNIFACQQICG